MAERVIMAMLIGAIALGCGVVLLPFASALLAAAILAFTTWPAVVWIERHLRLPRLATASLMVALTAAVLAGPIAVAAPGSAAEIGALRHGIEAWFVSVPPAPAWLGAVPFAGPLLTDTWNGWASDLSAMGAAFRPYFGLAAERGLSLLLGVAGGLLQLFLTLFAAFFFWMAGEPIGGALSRVVLRVAGPRGPALIAVTMRTVRGTVYGIIGTALIQGMLTSAGLAIAHVPHALLLGTLAAMLAMLPIGAPLVWIPAGLALLARGHDGRGLFLLLYGTVVVSGADHVIRPYFISRGARIPFLLVVFGVLGGVIGFGVLGIFVGPVLLGIGFSLLRDFADGGPVAVPLTAPPLEQTTGRRSGLPRA